MRKYSELAIGSAYLCACLFLSSGCPRKDTNSSSRRTVTVWHWMTDKQETLEALAREYQAESGVTVSFELYAPSDVYNQKVRAASQAKRLPDVFGLLAEKHDLASFVKAGYVLDLSDELGANDGEWKSQFYASVLSHDEFTADNEYGIAPGYYGVPLDLMTVQMVYNKALFRQAGLDAEHPPQTWPEFIECGQKLRDAGVPVLISGFAEIWLIDCLASNYAFNVMGEQKVIDTFRGRVPYTDPDWVRVLGLFEELARNDLWVAGITNLNNKEAEQMFARGKAAIAFNGSWCVNVYADMNPSLEYGVFTPPPVTDAHPLRVWGSAGASFLVNAQSEHREEAVRFLKWLTQPAQQAVYARRTQSIPANKHCSGMISPTLATFARQIEGSTHPSRWPIMETPAVIEAFDKGIQLIIIGDKTPEEIAQAVQEVKAREGKRG